MHNQSLNPIGPQISMNRIVIADLPGVALPSDVQGKTAYELVSAVALNALIRQHAKKLKLDSSLNDHDLNLAFAECFDNPDGLVRTMAETIAWRFGRNLGFILAVLKRGDAVNRQARPEWDDRYWALWSKVSKAWLGGGLVSGKLGQSIQTHALRVVKQAGIDDFELHVSPYADSLALVGVARYAPQACQSVLVMDFGTTMLKRGGARYLADSLAELRLLPALPSGCYWMGKPTPVHLQGFLEDIVARIADSWVTLREMYPALSNNVFISMAAYIRNGQPLETQSGIYMRLRDLTPNLQTTLSERVSDRLKTQINIRLVHDGTAAATAYAGERYTAVITMGTALGVGFPPDDHALRPIRHGFKLVAAPVNR